jgi:hypothetical protein
VPAKRCENVTVVPLVKTPRTLTRSVAAPAKDQRSVLMKGVGRQLHPRILRFGSRFVASNNPDRHHGQCRIASRVLTRSEPGKPPATPGHNVRGVFFDGIHGTGFTLRPPLEIGLMSRAHGELRPRSAPVGRLGLRGRPIPMPPPTGDRQLDCTPWVRHENGDRLPGMFDMPEWTMDVY